MAEDAISELASTLQSASLNRAPSPSHDVNPSTAASRKAPVKLRSRVSSPDAPAGLEKTASATRHAAERVEEHEAPPSAQERPQAPTNEIPLSVLEPVPRQHAQREQNRLPPLPDLRFEQSYLARVRADADAGRYGRVAWLTFVDHVVMPLTQGVLWNLALFGWRRWNRAAKFSGQGVGARIRRWWWGVNNWTLPGEKPAKKIKMT